MLMVRQHCPLSIKELAVLDIFLSLSQIPKASKVLTVETAYCLL